MTKVTVEVKKMISNTIEELIVARIKLETDIKIQTAELVWLKSAITNLQVTRDEIK